MSRISFITLSLIFLSALITAVHTLVVRETTALGKDLEGEAVRGEAVAPTTRKRDLSFYISVESLLKKTKGGQSPVLIDIRNPLAFAKFRIQDSLNIPLYAIKTKSFLKSKFLVLVGEGYACSQLERACRYLRDSGFKIWILEGGLIDWKRKGVPLEGEVSAQSDLNRVPPHIFYREKDRNHWMVIDFSRSNQSLSPEFFPQAFSIPFSDDSEALASQVRALVGQKDENRAPYLMILDEDGEQYERIERLFLQAGIEDAFYLQGGLKGYKTFLAQQAAILQKSDSPRSSAGKCKDCP